MLRELVITFCLWRDDGLRDLLPRNEEVGSDSSIDDGAHLRFLDDCAETLEDPSRFLARVLRPETKGRGYA